MKRYLSLPALVAALALLTSCGGETDEPAAKPEFAETKTNPVEKKEEEPKKTEEKTDEEKEAERERRRKMAEERGKKWFEDKDIDGDGALTQGESGNMAWVFLHMADEDEDGAVTGEEIRSAIEEGRMRRPEPTKVIQIMDTDGDGMIGTAELPERVRPMLSFADVDGDGKVSLVEIEILNAQQDAGGGRFGRPGGGGGGDGDGGNPSP